MKYQQRLVIMAQQVKERDHQLEEALNQLHTGTVDTLSGGTEVPPGYTEH